MVGCAEGLVGGGEEGDVVLQGGEAEEGAGVADWAVRAAAAMVYGHGLGVEVVEVLGVVRHGGPRMLVYDG